MNNKDEWIIYIDESFRMNEGKYDDLIVGGILVNKKRKEKVFKILKQLKDLLNKDYKDEIKGCSLKTDIAIPFIEKLTLLKKDCKVFYWYDKIESKENGNRTQNEIFKREYNEIVTHLANVNLFKNVEIPNIDLEIRMDQKNGLSEKELTDEIQIKFEQVFGGDKELHVNIDNVKFVDSQKEQGVQMADIVANVFYRYHTNKELRVNNEKSFKQLKKDIIYINMPNRRKQGKEHK